MFFPYLVGSLTSGPLPYPLILQWYKVQSHVTPYHAAQCQVFLSCGSMSSDFLSPDSVPSVFLYRGSMSNDSLSCGSMSSDFLSRGSMSIDFLSGGSMSSISYPVVHCQVSPYPWFNVR
jgi:hypothetical protein